MFIRGSYGNKQGLASTEWRHLWQYRRVQVHHNIAVGKEPELTLSSYYILSSFDFITFISCFTYT